MKNPLPCVSFAFLAFAATIAGNAIAAEPTPVGVWTTIDDDSHQPRSEVEISEDNGVLSGKVVHIYPKPDEPADPRCIDCKGERHNQPVLGMTILWNMRRNGDNWDGGEVLDPETGDTYRATMHPTADGKKLELRGYVGISLFGRTQVWERAPAQ
jgi:uncharacterized protein (DUF2147 family)